VALLEYEGPNVLQQVMVLLVLVLAQIVQRYVEHIHPVDLQTSHKLHAIVAHGAAEYKEPGGAKFY